MKRVLFTVLSLIIINCSENPTSVSDSFDYLNYVNSDIGTTWEYATRHYNFSVKVVENANKSIVKYKIIENIQAKIMDSIHEGSDYYCDTTFSGDYNYDNYFFDNNPKLRSLLITDTSYVEYNKDSLRVISMTPSIKNASWHLFINKDYVVTQVKGDYTVLRDDESHNNSYTYKKNVGLIDYKYEQRMGAGPVVSFSIQLISFNGTPFSQPLIELDNNVYE